MSNNRLHVLLRPMTVDDIVQVTALDRLSFPTPWSERTYRYEVMDNENSFMFVLEPLDLTEQPNGGQPLDWLSQWLGIAGPNASLIAGYSGFWHIADEAHISTIAVHPDWRGQHLGELLLWSMIRQAIRRRAVVVTLEVRASNALAQNLYRKYGFEISGRRRGYYRDNQEDAYMMTLTPLDAAYRERMVAFGKALAVRLRVADKW